MKKLLSLLTTFSLSAAVGINVIGCKTNGLGDFPGNNQVAKAAAPAVINAVNNFLMYNILYIKGASAAENKFYYNYQEILQNQWERYPSLEDSSLNPWTNNDQGTTAVNSLAVALYTVTLLGNSKDKPSGINGAVARIMPNESGTLFQTAQSLVPSSDFVDAAMYKKATVSSAAKKTLMGYYHISGKAKIHEYGYSVLPDLSAVDLGWLKKDFFTTDDSETDITKIIIAELDKESNIKIDPAEVNLVVKTRPSGGTPGGKLAVGTYELSLEAKKDAKTIQGLANFKIDVVDKANFKFNLETIPTKYFSVDLTVDNKVSDLKAAVKNYVESFVAPAVDKAEIEYSVENETDDTKALLAKPYKVIVAAKDKATTVVKKLEIIIGVLNKPVVKLDLAKFSNKIPAPSFLNSNYKEDDLKAAVKAATLKWMPREYKNGVILNTTIDARPSGGTAGGSLVEGKYTVAITPASGEVTGTYKMDVQVMKFKTNETVDIYWAGVDIPVANITNG
ncbi:lipoprotein [Spiroplasma sp. SV19]|uniref:lipoprotein n=1 Tax=Spiroplasma sp. SV19 TaxID=2570468 RepID=UPI0024B6DBDA|nr:lipoprotein [Spiroplasma sp. SV19]WHQ36981.1 hypothetical protein E7Y35_03665 [Spiroplasma sp. SV19]